MKHIKKAILCMLATALLTGCGGGGEPVATSLFTMAPADGQAAPTPTPDGAVQNVARQNVFTADETFFGLALQTTRPEATRLLGTPVSQQDDTENGSEYWDYDGIILQYDRNADGDKLLCSIVVRDPDAQLLRGLRIGDDFQTVLHAFYVDASLSDTLVDGDSVLYYDARSSDSMLPPRGILSFAKEEADTERIDYDRMLEYLCPAQPYPDSLYAGDQSAYLSLPHHVLRFYFTSDVLVQAELSYESFKSDPAQDLDESAD